MITAESTQWEKAAFEKLARLGAVARLQLVAGILNFEKMAMSHFTIGLKKFPINSVLNAAVRLKGSPNILGELGSVVNGATRNVNTAGVGLEFRNLGLGRKMYGAAIRQSFLDRFKGGPIRYFASDQGGNTSPAAMHVWESLKRRGYPVKTEAHPLNPRYRIDLDEMVNFYKDPELRNQKISSSAVRLKLASIISRCQDNRCYEF